MGDLQRKNQWKQTKSIEKQAKSFEIKNDRKQIHQQKANKINEHQ